ncbi:anaerobic regulatory protein [Paenibacillus sp. J31TS4]|uniref:Crp/Fnr family transcriptional regulator n=1 Tax=Paenibacillus sp. J31TS4 TaxID=2807195 RepID=UPI001B0B01F0|nr:Crp/Fnr family transcriptional regulator [Paenibacillus sp. J31TS4]GIP39120.1 anaerobic regulatory protein [Paenibacillus sp. J31TS4]
MTSTKPADAGSPRTYQIEHFLSDAHFHQLMDAMTEQTIQEGSHLFWEGEPADRLFYIKKGKVKISKSTEDGKDFILLYLQEGDFFGEFAADGSTRFSYTAEAVQDTKVGLVAQRDLETLIAMSGEFALGFIKWMSLMQRATESKFRDLMLFGKKGALASTLIRLTNSYGDKREDGTIRITLKLSNTDLANMIGTTRESVNRLLSAYRDEGLIDYDVHHHIMVLELAKLKAIVCCPDCPSEICRI